MRILVVVDGYFPGVGGAELQAELLSRALLRAGHAVRVVAPRLDRRMPVHEDLGGLHVERIAYPQVRLLGAAILWLKMGWKLLRERDETDAIHVHMVKNLAAVAGLLRPLLRASLTIKISGAFECEGGILDPQRRYHPLYGLMRLCVRGSDSVQCISRATRAALLAAGFPPHRIRMIPNAVDLTRFDGAAPVRAEDAPCTVGYVGRMTAVKGVRTLLEAWPQVVARRPARLVLAGEGALLPELRERTRALGVAGSVRFTGVVDDVPGLLRDLDVYVQPSLTEGLPNAVLEAMAAHLPVVASRVGGNEDLVIDGENGLLVPPRDPAALARAIERLAANPGLRRRMGERSRRLVEQGYPLPVVIRLLESAYRREP